NFLSSFLTLARQGNSLNAISDMFGTPTYARDLAQRLRRLALMDLPGTYHVVNSGEGVSFERFARAALEMAGLDADLLHAISLTELNRPAPRPINSRLRCLLSDAVGLAPLPKWQDALGHFVASQGGDGQSAVTGGENRQAGHGH